MADGQLSLVVSLVMVALFSVAIIGYSMGFAIDNSAAINIADDVEVSALNVSGRAGFDNFKNDSEDTYQSIISSTVVPGSDVVENTGSFAITLPKVITLTYDMMNLGYKKVFGSGGSFGIFVTMFFAVIGLMFALYLIKTWRGSP